MGGGGGGAGEGTIYMPISTEGSSMPTTRPKTCSPARGMRKDEWDNLEFRERPKKMKVKGKGRMNFDGAF